MENLGGSSRRYICFRLSGMKTVQNFWRNDLIEGERIRWVELPDALVVTVPTEVAARRSQTVQTRRLPSPAGFPLERFFTCLVSLTRPPILTMRRPGCA